MTDLGNVASHLCWQQRLKREANESMKFSTVLDRIREKRPENKKHKPIQPFKVVTPARQIVGGSPKVSLEATATNPSDPNSIKDLGPIIQANVQEINIDEVNEVFTEDQSVRQTINEDPELDKDLEDDEAIKYIEELRSNQGSKATDVTTASRLAERKKHEMVKTLIKRAGDNDDAKSVGSQKSKRSRSSQALITRMNDRLKEDFAVEEGQAEKVASSNPVLKALVNENKMDKYVTKTRSDKSLVSDSALGSQVRALKTELEKERKAKDKALDILKKLQGGAKDIYTN